MTSASLMILNDFRKDALTELINITFGLTASKLSEISGHRVLLEAPVIFIHPMEALAGEMNSFMTGGVVTIHQVFTGPVSGDAILYLSHEGSVKLCNLLVAKHLRSQRCDFSRTEILTEVSNMLLSACLGIFGNLLEAHITFSVPQLLLDSFERFLTSHFLCGDELRYAVLITASFNIQGQGVVGRIVIVLGVSSLERLIEAVERWDCSHT